MNLIIRGSCSFLLVILSSISRTNILTRAHEEHITHIPERFLESFICPIKFGDKMKYPFQPNDLFREVSYMASSSQTQNGDPIVWIGSDGYRNDLNAANVRTGKIIRTFYMDVPNDARGGDIESMALGPCSRSSRKLCIYVGNIGNNPAEACRNRSCTEGIDTVFIYKVKEPDILATPDGTKLPVATMEVDYHRETFPTNRADAESMFVDTTGDMVGGSKGDIYIITKFPYSKHLQRLAKLPARMHELARYGGSVQRFSLLNKGRMFDESVTFTGAEMSMDGRLIAVRSYTGVYFFPRNTRSTSTRPIDRVLRAKPCSLYHDSHPGVQVDGQYESVDLFDFNGKMYVSEASECWQQKPCVVNFTMTELLFG